MRRLVFAGLLFLLLSVAGAAQTTTTNLSIAKPQAGQAQPNVTIATGFDNFDSAVAGRLSKSVAGSSDVTLTTAEARNAILEFTGALTGSINVIVPAKNKPYLVYNATSGAFTLTVKTSGGTGIAVTQGNRVWLYCDATNVVETSVSGGGANTTLSNLSTTSANTSLLPQSGKDLGATATPWRDIYFYGSGTFGSHSIQFTGTPTGNRVITVPDRTATMATTSGALTSGNCAKFDASGNLVDNGSTCAGSGANTTLSNLSTTSANADLLPQSGKDLGAAATPWRNIYFYGSGTFGSHSIQFTGTPTGNRVITVPDRTATMATTSGTLTSGNCAKFDASGNLVDHGSACGGGGSGLNPTGSSTTNGDITLVGQAVSGGDVLLDLTPASSSGVASEVPNFVLRAATTTTNATVADFSFAKFLRPTLASNSSRTTTNAATLYIENSPAAGTNITITNPLALWVDDGNARFDGFVGVGTVPPATTQFYVKSQSSGNVAALIDSAAGSSVNIVQVRRDSTDVFVLNSLGGLAHTPVASTATTPRVNFQTTAETGLGTTSENPWARFGGDSSGATVTRQWNAGTVSLQRENIFVGPTYAFASASTMSDAITIDVGTPTAGSNATITRSTGLRVKPSAAAHHGVWIDGPIFYTGDALSLGQSGSKIVRFVGSGGTINTVLKADGALASNATDGFTYFAEYSGTGAPTGTPTSYTGAEPAYFQRDNINGVYDFWTYSNSGWRSIGGQFKRYDTGSGNGAQTLDFNSSSSANVTRVFTLSGGNATFTFSNPPPAGSLVTVVVVQDGTGSRTVTWPGSVVWVAGSAPTLTTTASKRDVFVFMWNGSNYYEVSRALNL